MIGLDVIALLLMFTASVAGVVMCWRYQPRNVEFHMFRAIALLGCLAAVLIFGFGVVAVVGFATGMIEYPIALPD